MTWLELLAEIEDKIEREEINQFDEVNKEILKKLLDKTENL